jgi:methyl-accepting chemotaxis protein
MRGERMSPAGSNRRKKYIINKKIQVKYAVLSIAMLLVYTLLFLIALFGPPIYLFTSADVPSAVRVEAANSVLLINSYLWPGIGVIILLFGSLSIFITHRIVGPIYAVEKVIGRITDGDLSARVRLRKNDDLREFGQAMNRMLDKQETTLSVLNEQFLKVSSRLREKTPGQASQSDPDIMAELGAIEKILVPYGFGNTQRKEHRQR